MLDSKRDEFLTLLPQIKINLAECGATEIKFYEGTDQPGLFVEEFLVSDMNAYEEVKKWHKEGRSQTWESFHSCIMGGKDKVHIWAFSELAEI